MCSVAHPQYKWLEGQDATGLKEYTLGRRDRPVRFHPLLARRRCRSPKLLALPTLKQLVHINAIIYAKNREILCVYIASEALTRKRLEVKSSQVKKHEALGASSQHADLHCTVSASGGLQLRPVLRVPTGLAALARSGRSRGHQLRCARLAMRL